MTNNPVPADIPEAKLTFEIPMNFRQAPEQSCADPTSA